TIRQVLGLLRVPRLNVNKAIGINYLKLYLSIFFKSFFSLIHGLYLCIILWQLGHNITMSLIFVLSSSFISLIGFKWWASMNSVFMLSTYFSWKLNEQASQKSFLCFFKKFAL